MQRKQEHFEDMRFRVQLVRNCDELVYRYMQTDPNIMFCKPADDEEWQEFFSKYDQMAPGDEEKVMGGYYRLLQFVSYFNSTAV